ncbi:MAG: hypothetical protein ACXVA9_11735, partial [Bdellovibrionales bacterium]
MHNAVTVQRHSKPVVIKANSPTSMTIKGIFGANGEKTVLAEYQPLPKMSDSKERVYDAQHWGGRGETVAPEGKSVPIWKFKYFVCEDDSCQTKQEVENYDKLEKLARTDLRSAVPLDLERAMLGTSALTSCCQSKSCRKVAKDNISINLKGPGEGESAK